MNRRWFDELLCLAAVAVLLALPVVLVFWQAGQGGGH